MLVPDQVYEVHMGAISRPLEEVSNSTVDNDWCDWPPVLSPLNDIQALLADSQKGRG
jgi:hypothetical protein